MINLRPIWLRTILAWLVLPVLAAALLPMTVFVSLVALMRDGWPGFHDVWASMPVRAAGDLLLGRGT